MELRKSRNSLNKRTKIISLVTATAAVLVLVVIIRLNYPSPPFSPPHKTSLSSSASINPPPQDIHIIDDHEKCDIFTGEWIPNPHAPYYTNTTCWAIHEHQNCIKYGRPNSDFLKWRWKPDVYDLLIFNPFQFLDIVRGKSLAFVGDSVGRNQMQSMICLLSRDPDLIVEAMPTSSSQSAKVSMPPQQSSSSATQTSDTRQRSSGSSGRTSGASTTPPTNLTSLRWDPKTIQFSVNAWVFFMAILAIFPLVPRNLSNRAYRLSFLGTACSSVYSLYSLYGKPRAWNLQALQVWFQSVIVTKDFMYSIYCLTFVTSHLCLKFALLPIMCRALEYVAKFLRRNFSRSTLYKKYLEDACIWVESNATTLSILSSQAEIGLGCLLIISLLSWQRNIIQTFMYWQLLKLMYHAPATASYHRSAWSNIGQSTNPLIQRYAPFLNTPIATIQKWWLR